jgi:hypothetical protein
MKKTNFLVLILVLCLAVKVANADFTFGRPQNLGPIVNSASMDAEVSVSSDGLTMYFASTRPGGFGYEDIYVTTRLTVSEPWGPPINIGPPVNSSYREAFPLLSADCLTLYFSDYYYGPDRPGGQGHDLWMTKRASCNDPWGTPVNMGPQINSSANDLNPMLSRDELTLVFVSLRTGGSGSLDLWMSTRLSTQDEWGPPVNLGPLVNSSSIDSECGLSSDSLCLFFMSDRAGGFGSYDIWLTTRKSRDDPWGPAVNLGPTVNTGAGEASPTVAPDGRALYICSNRAGSLGDYDIYKVPVVPIVDFNGDGIIDSYDMCIIVDYWGTDDLLCDIGPMPWGDGIVNVQDLIVLAEYLFEDVNDPTLLVHLALDETEGDIAQDSANNKDGTVYGDPSWQPEGGVIAGALQLDGIDDYVNTPFVLNPASGRFSVFAWIKDGAPGQVVISQMDSANWLFADPVEGNLMTELKGPGRSGKPLLSQTNIADGNWHRVGFVWDGSNRVLYIDGIEAAQDTQTGLEGLNSGLYIGCGKAMEAGTFFSGLIDDVRIYNRVVRP